jgi:hypothetical protein
MTNSDGWNSLRIRVTAVSAVIALLGGVLTLVIKWDDWFSKKTSCTISGIAFDYFTHAAAADLKLGWESPGSVDFHAIASSDPEGKFSGSCKGADDGNGQWELLYTGEPYAGNSALPCLTTKHTDMWFKNEGDHSAVNVAVVSC